MIKKTYIDFKVDQLIDNYLDLDQENSKILENLESLILINEGIVGDISTFINRSKQNTENAIITLCASKDQIGDVIKICHETIKTGFENLQNKGNDHSSLINLFTELVKSGKKLVGFTIQTLKSSSYSSETINIISTK